MIDTSQGGDYKSILSELRTRFPSMPLGDAEDLAERIEIENMVSACSFCNSMTSHDKNSRSMAEVITSVPAEVGAVVSAVQGEARKVIQRKRGNVKRKLKAIRRRFDTVVRQELSNARKSGTHIKDI
ncbi:hypothetical protein ACFL0H_11595 [Thermodesulfobacteriota bacterium]